MKQNEITEIAKVKATPMVKFTRSDCPKAGTQISILASLFPFLDRGTYSRGSKNGVLVTS